MATIAPCAVADPTKNGESMEEWLAGSQPGEATLFALYSPATEGFLYLANAVRQTAWLQTFLYRLDAEKKAENLDLHQGVSFPWLEVVEMTHGNARQLCLDVPVTPQMKARVLGYRVGTMVNFGSKWRYVTVHEESVGDDRRPTGRSPG